MRNLGGGYDRIGGRWPGIYLGVIWLAPFIRMTKDGPFIPEWNGKIGSHAVGICMLNSRHSPGPQRREKMAPEAEGAPRREEVPIEEDSTFIDWLLILGCHK